MTSRLRNLLRGADERFLPDSHLPPPAVRHGDGQLRAELRQLDRNHRVPDVSLEAGRVDRVGDVPPRLAAVPDGPPALVVLRFPGDRLPGDLHADELPLHTLCLDPPQGLLPDEIRLLVQVDEPAEADLDRVLVEGP